MSPTEKQTQLPHHKLIAYQLALELVQLVARTRIGEAHLRAQARKSATSAAEIAGALGACAPGHVQAVVELGTRLKNMLSRLVR